MSNLLKNAPQNLAIIAWQSLRRNEADTAFESYFWNPDLYKYSIVTSVASWNLTWSVKNYLGADPSASAPFKYQDWSGTIRTVTSALSVTANAATNYLNLWSAELATKEVDLFPLLQWNTTTSATNLLLTRYPAWNTMSDYTNSNTWEKGLIWIVNYNSTDKVVNIWRFNAILSAWAWYTWSIPTTSVIINRPIFETQWGNVNKWVPTLAWTAWVAPTWWTNLNYDYQIIWNKCFIRGSWYNMTAWTWVTILQVSLPFTASLWAAWIQTIPASIWIWDSPNLTYAEINFQSSSMMYIKCVSVWATYFSFQWYYSI